MRAERVRLNRVGGWVVGRVCLKIIYIYYIYIYIYIESYRKLNTGQLLGKTVIALSGI